MVTDSESRFDELFSALKQRNFRLTPQRIELVRLIAASDGHPNAAEFYARIKRQFPTISPATVYKTLALLKEMDQVLEIDLHGDSHYDGKRPFSHPHLICIQCGKISDTQEDLDRSPIVRIEDTTGYKIIRTQVSYFGLCPECQSAA